MLLATCCQRTSTDAFVRHTSSSFGSISAGLGMAGTGHGTPQCQDIGSREIGKSGWPCCRRTSTLRWVGPMRNALGATGSVLGQLPSASVQFSPVDSRHERTQFQTKNSKVSKTGFEWRETTTIQWYNYSSWKSREEFLTSVSWLFSSFFFSVGQCFGPVSKLCLFFRTR